MQTSPILDALFPQTRQAILSTLLLQPERRWYLSELARYLDAKPSTLEREIASLTDADILVRNRDGNRVYYQANLEFSLLPELRGLFLKTTGAVSQLDSIITPFGNQIDFAFIFGSYARGEQKTKSDIDLMLIGDMSMALLAIPLRGAEETIGAEVNVSLYSMAELKSKWLDANHFVTTVLNGPKIFLKGTQDELANALEQSSITGAHYEQAGTR